MMGIELIRNLLVRMIVRLRIVRCVRMIGRVRSVSWDLILLLLMGSWFVRRISVRFSIVILVMLRGGV